MPTIVQLTEWPEAAIQGLLSESEQEGFRFVRRARDEWLSGANRFSSDGEAFFGAFEAGQLVAVGGINRGEACCGRLRRVYVRRSERGRGVGRHLVRHILEFGSRHYARAALRCDTAAADQFYRALGFSRTNLDPTSTHLIELKGMPNHPPDPTPAPGLRPAG